MFDPRRTLFLIIKYKYETNYILPAPDLFYILITRARYSAANFFETSGTGFKVSTSGSFIRVPKTGNHRTTSLLDGTKA